MRTIDLLYQAYVDERMESAESGEEQEAIRQFRNICSKADNSLMKLQGDIWDSMVQYGDSREKQGFIAGFIAHEAGERACPNPYTGQYCREGIKKFLQSEATETKADRIKKGR